MSHHKIHSIKDGSSQVILFYSKNEESTGKNKNRSKDFSQKRNIEDKCKIYEVIKWVKMS